MKTTLTTDIDEAARFIRAGELVAFPTETVYGLGANAGDESAVAKIYVAKGRPRENPMIVHVPRISDVATVASDVSNDALVLMDAFFPGPLTLVLPRHPSIPAMVSAGLPTVGVRMPGHEVALALLRSADRNIVAPSANRSGRPSATTWEAVQEDLDGRISCILQGEMTDVGLESTVLDCTVDPPVILRPGAISLVDLQSVAPGIIGIGTCDSQNSAPRSPGMAFRHYSPTADVRLIDNVSMIPSGADVAYIGHESAPEHPGMILSRVVSDVDEYARALFDFFRRCDRAHVKTIYCQRVEETALGLALMDRIYRAAKG